MSDSFIRHKKEKIKKVFEILGSDCTEENFISTFKSIYPEDWQKVQDVWLYEEQCTPRSIEHKHFEFGKRPYTYITREYPQEWKPGDEPYYPVNDEKNQKLYARYAELARNEKNVIFGGRLAEYKYYDMDDVIKCALECVEKHVKKV